MLPLGIEGRRPCLPTPCASPATPVWEERTRNELSGCQNFVVSLLILRFSRLLNVFF